MNKEIEAEKDRIKKDIMFLLESNCGGNAEKCVFGYCSGRFVCHKEMFTQSGLPKKKLVLKSIRKNLRAKLNKQKGRKHPHYLPDNLKDQVKHIIGCDIREHPLIKGQTGILELIEKCTTINQIVQILERRKWQTGNKITKPIKEVYESSL